jgi:hypothetical protein
MLSVSIPPDVIIALEDVREQVKDLLAQIPTDARPWKSGHLLQPDALGWQLWDLLHSQKGLGPTKISKLLAAKRPHLFPVYDKHISHTLLSSTDDSYWGAWLECFSGDRGLALVSECQHLLAESDAPETLSVLRILDVVIWMRVYGNKELSKIDRFWDP